jgi:Uma2 family endonuclease
LDAYERRGVRGYWIVDPGNRLVSVYKRIAGAGFAPAETIVLEPEGPSGAFASAVLPDFRLDVRALVAAAESVVAPV